MTLAAFAFWVFALSAVASGLMVIASRNPVHSVLFLILAFISAAGLFVLIGAEYLAMLLVVVYVGAVAVLFLFVVMMLDVDFAELRAGFIRNAPLGALVGLILMMYPPLAKQARIQGTVRLQAIIAKDGSVVQLEVISGHPLLQQSALQAVSQWKYRPTMLNNEPVEVVTTVDVVFTLSS